MFRRRFYCGVLAALMGAGGVSVALPAAAADKEKLYRTGTYIGSAATIYALTQGKGTWALIGGGATLLSYSQWKKAARNRRSRERSASSYRAYRASWLRKHRGKRIVRAR